MICIQLYSDCGTYEGQSEEPLDVSWRNRKPVVYYSIVVQCKFRSQLMQQVEVELEIGHLAVVLVVFLGLEGEE